MELKKKVRNYKTTSFMLAKNKIFGNLLILWNKKKKKKVLLILLQLIRFGIYIFKKTSFEIIFNLFYKI